MNLQLGGIYFVVSFKDEALTLPLIRTLIFRQEVFRENGSKGYIFDQLSEGDTEVFYVDKGHVEELIVDRQGLLRMLEQAFRGNLSTRGWIP